jgi:hypothetical protein
MGARRSLLVSAGNHRSAPRLIKPAGSDFKPATSLDARQVGRFRFLHLPRRPEPSDPKYYRLIPNCLVSSIRGPNWRCERTTLASGLKAEIVGNQLLRGEAHYEIRLGEREESTSKEFLHAVLRTNRRRLSARAHHPFLLLQLQVLPRSLQARLIRTQQTCEGIMTIQDENHPVEACDRARLP